MANPNIKIKRSAVPGKRPTVDQLPLGELGLNTYDGQLFAQIDTGGVGIATTVATLTPWKESYGGNSISYDGNVSVGSNLTVQNTVLNGTLSVGSTTGLSGQYLQSTGVGVTWASGSVLRNTSSTVAIANTDTFALNYTVGFLDVYVNGVKLAPSDFTASDGTSVIFNETTYGGEIIDFHAYNTPSTGVSPNVLHNPPTSSSSSGLPGQMSYDSSFLYVCIAPNSWKRVSLSSF
jgi:hypothetical protein